MCCRKPRYTGRPHCHRDRDSILPVPSRAGTLSESQSPRSLPPSGSGSGSFRSHPSLTLLSYRRRVYTRATKPAADSRPASSPCSQTSDAEFRKTASVEETSKVVNRSAKVSIRVDGCPERREPEPEHQELRDANRLKFCSAQLSLYELEERWG